MSLTTSINTVSMLTRSRSFECQMGREILDKYGDLAYIDYLFLPDSLRASLLFKDPNNTLHPEDLEDLQDLGWVLVAAIWCKLILYYNYGNK